jgi:hypothetical protein
MNGSPFIIWITGLPGSGKTTLALNIIKEIKPKKPIFHIDGDVIRHGLFQEFGYSEVERRNLSIKYQNLAKIMINQEVNVVVSTVSMYSEIYDSNKKIFENYFEICLKPSMQILHEGPRKNIYQQELSNEATLSGLIFPNSSDLYLAASSNKDRELWVREVFDNPKFKRILID